MLISYNGILPVFGNISVISEEEIIKNNHTYWKCRCKCGYIWDVRADHLRDGKTKNCKSCGHIKDIKGQKFGKLTALKLGEKTKDSGYYWICKCECGNIVNVRGSCLRSGNTTSCKCSLYKKYDANPSWKGYKEISGTYFASIKRGKDRLGKSIEFSITIEYVWDLFIKQDRKCALSGEELVFAETAKSRSSTQTASLDRIDSSKGYIEGNVQWIHKELQNMKWDKTDINFIDWCNKISHYQKDKNVDT